MGLGITDATFRYVEEPGEGNQGELGKMDATQSAIPPRSLTQAVSPSGSHSACIANEGCPETPARYLNYARERGSAE